MYNKRMKQATQNIRTIDHADHTDIERLFYAYSPDGKGEYETKAVWAVVWCGLKQEKQAMYSGYTESQSQTESRRARMEGWMQQREIMKQIVSDVQPRMNYLLDMCYDIGAQNGELGADELDIYRWMDELTQPIDQLARARAIALPNGQLRSYATYKSTGKAQTLTAEEVDGERLGE